MLNSRNNLSGDLLDKGHIEKLTNASQGLTREIKSIEGSLQNPNLSNSNRQILQNSLNKAKIICGEIDGLTK